MTNRYQTIALIILVPMLIFTFIITVKSESPSKSNSSQQTIYKYFEYRNDKNLESLSKILNNKKDISTITLDSMYLEKISLLSLVKTSNKEITKVYIKNNKISSEKDIMIYNVKYEILYKDNNKLKDRNGTHQCMFILIKGKNDDEWLIDIAEI